MFERFEARAGDRAEAVAAERTARLAEQLRSVLPRDVGVEASEDGVALSGRGLERRLVLDSSLRWTIAGLLK